MGGNKSPAVQIRAGCGGLAAKVLHFLPLFTLFYHYGYISTRLDCCQPKKPERGKPTKIGSRMLYLLFMRLEELFDFQKFAHKELFVEARNLWDPIGSLDSYLKSFYEVRKDKLLVGAETKIDPSAKIEGFAIIGKNCQVNEGVLLRDGVMIGDNCVIGHATEVKHSILLNDTNAAHFNYIGDSILGNNVNFAAGAIAANFKHNVQSEIVSINIDNKQVSTGLRKFGSLVGDGTQVGCNAVLDPGTIVGKNTLIYPLAAIRGTVPEGKIVKYKQEYEIVDKV